jgi:hypothetical protein
MREERMEQQNFYLSLDSQSIYNDTRDGNKNKSANRYESDSLFLNRWLRISLRTQKYKSCVFNNLLHHINVETLREAYNAMDKNKALGVDKVSKEAYGTNLVNMDKTKTINFNKSKENSFNFLGFTLY